MHAQAHAIGEPAPRRRRVLLFARDWILIVILLFMAGLVASKWSDYDSCADPMAAWLVVNFLGMLVFRLLHFLAQYCWNGRPGSWVASKGPGVVMAVDLFVVWPLLLVWMVLGCVWYDRSNACLPRSMSGWAFIAWIVLTLLYLFSYALLVFGRVRARAAYPRTPGLEPGSVRAWLSAMASAHLVVVEFMQRQELLALGLGPDVGRGAAVGNIIVLQRQQHDAGGALPLMMQQQGPAHTGLTLEQIDAIPLRQLTLAERCNELCSICLVEFAQLPPASEQEEGGGGGGGAGGSTEEHVAVRMPRSSSDVESARGQSASSPNAGLRVDTEGDAEVSTSTARMYSAGPVMVHALDCHHSFHRECLRVWLREEAKCPNCRLRIGPEVHGAHPPAPPVDPAQMLHMQAQLEAHSPMHLQQEQMPPGEMSALFVQPSPSGAHQSHQHQVPFSPWHGLRMESNIAPSPAALPGFAPNWQQQQEQR